MAVTTVYEVIEKQSGSEEIGPRKRYRRNFRVKVDDIQDGPKIVKDAVTSTYNVALGGPYVVRNDSDSTCRVVRITAERHRGEEPLIWDVPVEYSNDPTGVDNPLNEPAEFSLSFAQFQRAADRDLDNKPFVNSAKQPFDPPIEIDDSRPVLLIIKNRAIATFDLSQCLTYQDAINTDTVYGFGPYVWKMAQISPRTITVESGFQYYQVTYELHGRRELWYPLKVLNQGYYQLVDSEGTKKRELLLDKDSKQLTSPGLLKADGSAIGYNPDGSLDASPSFEEFNVYKRLPFAPLQLPPLPT